VFVILFNQLRQKKAGNCLPVNPLHKNKVTLHGRVRRVEPAAHIAAISVQTAEVKVISNCGPRPTVMTGGARGGARRFV
jgi:hypothetical protein